MVAALFAVAAILVGLPLLAWWFGGRRFWGRLRPKAEKDRYGEALRRHGVLGADAARVITAVNAGERLANQRLRGAAAELARIELAEYRRLGGSLSRRARIAVRTGLLMALAGLITAGLAMNDWQLDRAPWWILFYGPITWSFVARKRRTLERAIRVNTDPPERDSADGLDE